MDPKGILLDLLDESYDRFAWHGPNLKQALQGVDAKQASWRPPSSGTALWSIHEIVRHVAGHMQRCGASLMVGGGDPSLDDADERFPLPDLTNEEEWKREIEALRHSYTILRRGVSETTLARLQEKSPSRAYQREWTFLNYVYGVAFHNVYHAAQIVSIRKRQGAWTEWKP